MRQGSVYISLFFLVLLWRNALSQQLSLYEKPSGDQIPLVYEAVKILSSPHASDLQGVIPDKNDIYLTHSLTTVPFLNGRISYYGQNILGNDGDFDFQLQKLFYTKIFSRSTLSAGIGYDFNRIRDTYNQQYYGIIDQDSNGNPIKKELHKRLTLTVYDENSFYGNVNTMLSLTSRKKLLFATDLLYTTQKGFKYYERFDESSKSSKYNTSSISYFDLQDHAYSYDYYLGMVYWKHKKSRRNRKFSLVWNLSWDHAHQHSEPNYIKGIRPYFGPASSELGTTTQYAGINNYQNMIMRQLSFSDLFPDLVTFERPLFWGPLHFQFVLDKMSVAFAGEYNVTDETYINRWERPSGIFWGQTDHTFTDSPVSLIFDHAFRFFLFKYLYAKVEYYSAKTVTYGHEFISADLDHRISTSFGAKFTIKDLFLCEIKHAFYTFNLGLSIYADYVDYDNRWHWGWRNDQGILLRFAVLK